MMDYDLNVFSEILILSIISFTRVL